MINELKKVNVFYFSPTHTTKTVVQNIALGTKLEIKDNDLTFINEDLEDCNFSQKDLVIVGLPVYGGRTPKVIRKVLNKLRGEETPIVLVATYGNRHYDDALIEMKDIFVQNGFKVIAAGAFLGEHSFTKKVATGRPNKEDTKKAYKFGEQVIEKIKKVKELANIEVPGNRPYKKDGNKKNIAPVPNENCKGCNICADVCPTGAISKLNTREVDPGKCIQCCACIKICNFNGREFEGNPLEKSIIFLETKCSDHREIEIFL
ncbi:4Fe-4S binding protein [Fusobacterium sp. MFO224]|uniref:4Fe-4S binding protein n=1 Tax=Fusobacterium sp. MFO224 TaxID=3378070 RepID=UPI0038537F7D